MYNNANDESLTSDADLDSIQKNIAVHMRAILRELRIDTDNDPNSRETAERVAKMYTREIFTGRFSTPPKITVFPNTKQVDQMVVTGPLTVKSFCSHHFMPIVGQCWVGYIPDASLIGLSKVPRVVEWFSRRPQIQEELCEQISGHLYSLLHPKGLGVYIEAQHFCQSHRGVNENPNSLMHTTSLRGNFQDLSAKQEFLSMIKRN